MNKLIFNEKRYIEEILNSHKQLDIGLFQLIQLIATYYYQEGYDDKIELARIVNREIESFDIDGYFYEKNYKIIDSAVKSIVQYDAKLKDIANVPIYQSEYNIISSCGDSKHQKLLSTLYVMARWNGDSGWTSSNKCKLQHIKKSANLNCTNSELNLLLHDLFKDGYIKISRNPSKPCYQIVNFNADKNEDVKLLFDSFDDVGNKFLASKDNNHIICSVCGRLVKRTSPRMKYCKKCAEIKKRENNKKIQQRRRQK